jgi:hypothetical protein
MICDKSKIYHEDGSGNSLFIKNMRVNSLDGKIIKLPFLQTKSDFNTNDITNSATIEQSTPETANYNIIASFEIDSFILGAAVYVKTVILTIKKPITKGYINSNQITINSYINELKIDIQVVLNKCVSGSFKSVICEIEVMSDLGVKILNLTTAANGSTCEINNNDGGI